MAYRDYWQNVIDLVYDDVNSELNTQEEIDDLVASTLSGLVGFTSNQDDIPSDYHGRAREFYSPLDLLVYLQEGGIPDSAVWIWEEVTDDDNIYHAYISDGS